MSLKQSLLLFFVSLVAIAQLASAQNTSKSNLPSHQRDHCFNTYIGFTLETTFPDPQTVQLEGPAWSWPFWQARLKLIVDTRDVRPGIAGLTGEQTVAALAKGYFEMIDGDRLFVDVVSITNNNGQLAAGIHTVTGGTGRFEGASGYLNGTGELSNNGLTRKSQIRGEICLPPAY